MTAKKPRYIGAFFISNISNNNFKFLKINIRKFISAVLHEF